MRHALLLCGNAEENVAEFAYTVRAIHTVPSHRWLTHSRRPDDSRDTFMAHLADVSLRRVEYVVLVQHTASSSSTASSSEGRLRRRGFRPYYVCLLAPRDESGLDPNEFACDANEASEHPSNRPRPIPRQVCEFIRKRASGSSEQEEEIKCTHSRHL